ncbi:MAG: M28 family metallopeptidase, partial [Clostridia bacterium]|nr:M28 family metallopeptidase [Clostridia bacterium]
LFLCILLTGCGGNPPKPLSSQSPPGSTLNSQAPSASAAAKATPSKSIQAETTPTVVTEEVFKKLCSQELKGRVMGQSGNTKAQEEICGLFKALDLKPYKEGYLDPVFVNSTKRGASTVIMRIPGENSLTLARSADYSIAPGKAYDGKYRVVYQAPANPDEKTLLIVDESNDQNDSTQNNPNTGYIHPQSRLYKSYQRGAAPALQMFLDPTLITKLKAYDGKAYLDVMVEESPDIQTTDGNNVIGLIPGKSHESCLILSAHYDGIHNDTAALDNASGTYTLLRLAERLRNAYKDTSPDFDILICAFDGEERGLIGSAFFAEEVKKTYKHSLAINLDCVGLNGDDSYMVIGNTQRDSGFINELYGGLNAYGLKNVPGLESYQSDHIPFADAGIPAVTIGERDILSFIHSEQDTADKVDPAELDKLSQMVAEFVTDKAVNYIK